MLRFMILKRIREYQKKGIPISDHLMQTIYDDVSHIEISQNLLQATIHNREKINKLLIIYKVYSEQDIDKRQNHDRWSFALESFYQKNPNISVRMRDLLRGNI